MSFSDKRVLASRRLVHACVVVQLLAFLVSAKAMYGLHASNQAMLEPCEFQMFWLVPFSSSEGVPRGSWLHFAWRLLVWAQNAYLGLLFAGPFHQAEHMSRRTLREKLRNAGYTSLNVLGRTNSSPEEYPLRNRNVRSPVENVYLQYEFDRLPATVFTKYIEHAFTILVASVSMHSLARDFGGKSRLQHMDWGQRAPLIVCLIGVIHFTYAQARNFGSNSLKHLWEVELVTGAYPNSSDHPDDYPQWVRPITTPAWSLRFWQHMWCVMTTQRRLSTFRATNLPRRGPIKLTGGLNPSWWDIWKHPFPGSITLPEQVVQAETKRLWKQFDTLGPFGIREALLNGARINDIHDDDNRTVLLRLLNANQCHTRIVALALLMGADTTVTLPKNNFGIKDSTPLVVASGRGHENVACYLLDHCPKIPGAATALISAASSAHNDVANLLIGRGLDVNVRCPITDETALIGAASKGHVDTVHYLLQHGADVYAVCNRTGVTAFISAAIKGHVDTLRCLAKHGVNIHARYNNNRAGDIALFIAAANGRIDTVRYLLERGANINARYYKTGETALIAAAKRGKENVLKLLIDNSGIDINAKSHRGTECFNFDYVWSDGGRKTALYGVSDDYDPKPIEMLFAVRRHHEGDTALHQAACLTSSEPLKVLLSSSEIKVREQNLSGDTALIVAIRDGRLAPAATMVRLLLQKDPESAGLYNNVGKSALDFCLDRTPNGNTSILEALLEYHGHNVVGLDWTKSGNRHFMQWDNMSLYPLLHDILMKPVGNYGWSIDQRWVVLSASQDHIHEVDEDTPESPCIRLQLPPREPLRILRVHRIVFWIVSNDQGN